MKMNFHFIGKHDLSVYNILMCIDVCFNVYLHNG